MPYPSREMVLVPSAARNASGTSGDFELVESYTAVILLLDVTAASGTTETLNVYVQDGITNAASTDIVHAQPTGTVLYSDFCSFTQVTTAAIQKEFRIVGGGGAGTTQDFTPTDATLTAGTVRNGPIGRRWRVKWVFGANSHYTFSLVAQFIP